MKLLKPPKKKKKESDKWTYKVGSALGKKIDKIFSNKICKYIVLALFIIFIFIAAPIQKNIITVSVLIALLIASNILGKKK